MTNALLATIAAMIVVESGGDPRAVGDGGQAVGVLQIHPAYVADVNRITGRDYYRADRWSRRSSIEMAVAYLDHYGRKWEQRTGQEAGPEQWARIHNGGPRGAEKQSTEKYWQRVKAVMEGQAQ